MPREAEAGPEPDTEVISEGLTSQVPIAETDFEETEENPLTTGTIGETTIETQVENIDFDTHELALTEGIHRNSRYNVRLRRKRNYSHLHVILESLVMTQYPMHKRIKVFGDAGTAAVLEELQQLHARGDIEPRDSHKLSQNEKSSALEYLMFLKKKMCGKIKGRGCAMGIWQNYLCNWHHLYIENLCKS